MKYLKPFLENSNNEIDPQEIREICYELTDYGKFEIEMGRSNYHYVYIIGRTRFEFDDVKDVCLRLKEYLGEKYIAFYYLQGGTWIKQWLYTHTQFLNGSYAERVYICWKT